MKLPGGVAQWLERTTHNREVGEFDSPRRYQGRHRQCEHLSTLDMRHDGGPLRCNTCRVFVDDPHRHTVDMVLPFHVVCRCGEFTRRESAAVAQSDRARHF